jgi:Spy/CpxP family protein refolding chaperone
MSTAATDTRPTGRTNWPQVGRGTLLALLAISLALNLFFIAGAVWSRMHMPPGQPDERQQSQSMAEQLRLDPRQQQGFKHYMAMMHANGVKLRQGMAQLMLGAWDDMAKPQPNQAQIMQRYDEASRKWRDFQHESVAQTLDFLALLSPAQRDKFVAIIRERRAARYGKH